MGGRDMRIFKSDKVFIYSLFLASLFLLLFTLLFKDIAVSLIPAVISFFIAKSVLNHIITDDDA